MENPENVLDFRALKKWREMPSDWKELLLNNVFCSNCKITSVVDYTVVSGEYGIVLKGKCAKCGERVARSVES